jgi:hypothetical protein
MVTCHSRMPCSVPPHPDLLARTKLEARNLQGTPDQKASKKIFNIIHGEKGVPGMNDGTIFPRAHYDKPMSITAMSTAALDRWPLRGNVRFVREHVGNYAAGQLLIKTQSHRCSRQFPGLGHRGHHEATHGRSVVFYRSQSSHGLGHGILLGSIEWCGVHQRRSHRTVHVEQQACVLFQSS